MGYRVQLTIDADILDAVRETAKAAPRAMQTFVQRTVLTDLNSDLDALRVAPPPPNFPRGRFPWKTQRQRRYVMALYRRLGIRRYVRRVPGIEAKWQIVAALDLNRGVITAGNDSPIAAYVYAPHQQPFHAGRWPDPDRVLLDALARAEANLIAGWYSVADPLARGVRFA